MRGDVQIILCLCAGSIAISVFCIAVFLGAMLSMLRHNMMVITMREREKNAR